MADLRSGAAWGHVQRLFGLGTVSGLTEWQLLERYSSRRDEAAFAALVARHAPMVLGVCRRLLRNPDDVEDAFQATFLVLVRKAGALGPRDAVGHWLHGVAYRVALRARSESSRRRSRETTVECLDAEDPRMTPDSDLGPTLDEELTRLPASYRAAVVLCYLEGVTHEEAARQLGWPLGTVKGRLARARLLLRDRLARRGLALTSGGLAAAMSREAVASVPAGWSETVVKAAACAAAGEATAGVVSSSAVALAEGVLWTMFLNPWKAAVAALALSAALLGGVGALAQKGDANDLKPRKATATDATQARKNFAPTPAQGEENGFGVGPEDDLFTGPAPPAKDPDSGSTARRGYEIALKLFRGGELKAGEVHVWSRRLAEAETDPSRPASRRDAALGHLQRMKDLSGSTQKMQADGRVSSLEALNTEYFREEAERLLKAAGAGSDRPGSAEGIFLEADTILVSGRGNMTITASETDAGPGRDARSLAVFKTLATPVAMTFGQETPLEDVLKAIQEKTKSSEFPKGLPIYVDPIGLQEADKTMKTTVSIELDGVPLRRTLQLLLSQIGLIYRVEDGMVYVTSDNSEGGMVPLPSAGQEVSPLVRMQERFNRGEMSESETRAFIQRLKDRREAHRLQLPLVIDGRPVELNENSATTVGGGLR